MIKTLTTTLMLAVASCSFSPAYAQTTEECEAGAFISGEVANLRDQGASASVSYQILVSSNMDPDTAYALVLLIYTDLKNVGPDDVANVFYTTCVGSET